MAGGGAADRQHTERLYLRAELYMRPDEPIALSRSTIPSAEVLAADPETVTATFTDIVNTWLAGDLHRP